MQNDIDRARDALFSISSDLPRDQWIKAGMAAHAAGLPFDDFNAWSAAAPTYNAQNCRTTWRSFKAGKGVGAGSLFGMAHDQGWTDGKAQPAPRSRPAQPQNAKGSLALEIWNRCEPATADHPYIVSKQGTPDGLRVLPADDMFRIMGEPMAGALVVPVKRSDGSLSTLQMITPPDVAARLKASDKPSKLNLPACPVDGWFAVGKVTPDKPLIYVVEGIGQAWAVCKSIGACAVVCFGAGNMGKVAAALRQRDKAARLVICPDRGKETDAHKIAIEVGAAVVCMPECEPPNFDVNDLYQRDGFDVVAALLESATEPPQSETNAHPLAKFLKIDMTPKPPRWVLSGLVEEGVLVISGASGVGKTTAILPMGMIASGLIQSELSPKHWRHVVYVTEDATQAQRILSGIVNHSNLQVNRDLLDARFHLVDAKRLNPVVVVSVASTYRSKFTRSVNGVEILPLVVFDTKSAVFELESENDNSEASRMMAALKQGFDGLPVWLIGHIPKANIGRSDVVAMSARGAGSTDGDGNATAFLVREGDDRYLVLGKVRFEPKWFELEITSYTAQILAVDVFGETEPMTLRWGIAAPAEKSRKEAAEQAAELQSQQDDATLRGDIRDAIEVAWLTGFPLNRAGVRAKVRRKTSDVVAMLENLLNERWLHEVPVHAKVRTNNNRTSFLVNLSTEEHEAVLSGGDMPVAKLVIPESWQKQAIPSVPDPASNSVEGDYDEK